MEKPIGGIFPPQPCEALKCIFQLYRLDTLHITFNAVNEVYQATVSPLTLK